MFKTNSTTLIEKYLRQLAVDLKVSYDAIYNDYNIYSKGLSGVNVVEVSHDDENISKEIKLHEKMFICFIAYNKKYLDYFIQEIGEVSDYIESKVVLDTYLVISYFYNSTTNDTKELFKYCYEKVKDNFIYDVIDGVTNLINTDSEKREKMLNDCIDKFNFKKFIQLRDAFEIFTQEANEDVINTLNEKLAFVRCNVKRKRK